MSTNSTLDLWLKYFKNDERGLRNSASVSPVQRCAKLEFKVNM